MPVKKIFKVIDGVPYLGHINRYGKFVDRKEVAFHRSIFMWAHLKDFYCILDGRNEYPKLEPTYTDLIREEPRPHCNNLYWGTATYLIDGVEFVFKGEFLTSGPVHTAWLRGRDPVDFLKCVRCWIHDEREIKRAAASIYKMGKKGKGGRRFLNRLSLSRGEVLRCLVGDDYFNQVMDARKEQPELVEAILRDCHSYAIITAIRHHIAELRDEWANETRAARLNHTYGIEKVS